MSDDLDDKTRPELVDERDLGTALAESERVTAGILAAVPAGVVHVEATGAIRAANAEALRILGRSYDELTNKYTVDFEPETIFEDGSPCTLADYPVTKALMTGERQPATTIGVRRPDGELSWCIFRAVPVKDDAGVTTGAIVTIADITERKRAEEERTRLLRRLHEAERLDALGRLAGGVAHDFNNLLTVILGGLELHEQRSGGPIAGHLDEIRTAASQASDLTRQLLAFGRRQALEPSVFSLSEVVRRMAPMLRRLVGEAVDLEVRCDEQALDVHADPGQLERVIVNLIINARDAVESWSSKGTVTLTVGTLVLDDEEGGVPAGRYTALTVSDDGPGIDDEALPRIFEPFFTTKEGEGTGLGLATVHGIVTQSRGHLTVSPTPGGGATFRVLIPASEIPSAPPPPEEPAESQSRGHRILVVEDNDAVRKVVVLLLSGLGYDVVAFSAPEDALQLETGELEGFALLLTDVVMPDISGPELAHRVHERAPGLPVLFMSGHLRGQRSILPEGARLLEKPFTTHELSEAVWSLVDPQRLPEMAT